MIFISLILSELWCMNVGIRRAKVFTRKWGEIVFVSCQLYPCTKSVMKADSRSASQESGRLSWNRTILCRVYERLVPILNLLNPTQNLHLV
jgi:hypothetical protein